MRDRDFVGTDWRVFTRSGIWDLKLRADGCVQWKSVRLLSWGWRCAWSAWEVIEGELVIAAPGLSARLRRLADDWTGSWNGETCDAIQTSPVRGAEA